MRRGRRTRPGQHTAHSPRTLDAQHAGHTRTHTQHARPTPHALHTHPRPWSPSSRSTSIPASFRSTRGHPHLLSSRWKGAPAPAALHPPAAPRGGPWPLRCGRRGAAAEPGGAVSAPSGGTSPRAQPGHILFSVLGREVQLGASVAASGHGRGLSDPPSVLPTQRLPTARGPPLSARAPVTGSQRPTSPRRRSGGWGSSAGTLGTRTPPVTDATSASALGRTAPYLTDGDVSVPSAESPGRQCQAGRDVHHTYTERSEGSGRGSRGLHPGRKSGWAAGRATGGSGAQPNVGPPPPCLLSQRHPPGPRIPPLPRPN